MEERYIATVDLGTSKFALSIAKVNGDSVELLYYKEVDSDGVRKSQVFNPKRAAIPLKAAIKEAEEELGIKILQVVIGLPRYSVRQESAPASIERSDEGGCITSEEIDDIESLALDTYPCINQEEEEMYGAVAQSFSADDMIGLSREDIIGMTGDKIAGNFKVFIGKKKPVSNIDIMLNDAGVAPARKFFLPDATASAILSQEEKDGGVALVEMGAGITSVSIYQGGILRSYRAIPFGGKAITTDIKYIFGFKEVLAENIKKAFGACMPDRLQSMSEKVIQVNYDEDGTNTQVEVKYLSEIINARVTEIFEAILFAIQESGYSDKLRCGLVLTGGGACLTGCCNYLREMSGYNVRIGYPRHRNISVAGFPAISEPSAAASIGMLLLSKHDSHLSCTTEPQSVDDVEQGPDLTGTVFDASTAQEETAPARSKPSGGHKKGREKQNGSSKTLTWIVETVGKLFDEATQR